MTEPPPNAAHAGVDDARPAPRLVAESVSFAYSGDDVLKAVSIGVSAGEVVGVLGPNGSGKTTLLRCLLGFLHPKSGRVVLDGQDLARRARRDVARHIAVVPQEMPTDFPLRVGELVLLGRLPHLPATGLGFESDDDLRAAAAALEACGVSALSERPIHAVSGGELRRVFIARALCQAAAILLLDEPTAGLDLRHQIAIVRLLRAQAAAGNAVLVVLHDLNLAAGLCDRVVLLKDGGVFASGAPADVITPDIIARAYDVDVPAVIIDGSGRRFLVPPPR